MSPSTLSHSDADAPAAAVRGVEGLHDAPPLGAHLVTPRFAYVHHGIHVGGGRVVHYAGLSRLMLLRGPVRETTLEDFAGGRPVAIKHRPLPRFSPEEIVARARSRLGENRYRLTTNNCEHFAEWCLSGESRSEQVERYARAARATLASLGRRVRAVFEPAGRGIGTLPDATA